MSTLLEKALEKVVALPEEEQDAIASQILASLADEDAWKKRFAEKRDVIRRMAREALEEDERGETKALLVRESTEKALGGQSQASAVSCYDLARDLAGTVKGLPEDLAVNPKYLEGLGR